MKKFRIISDIHLEFLNEKRVNSLTKKLSEFQQKTPADYLILAGDITNREPKTLTSFKSFVRTLQSEYKLIFYVIGNHEYYGINNIPAENVFDLFSDITRELGSSFVLLNNDDYLIDSKRIFGATLWTDLEGVPEHLRLTDDTFISKEYSTSLHRTTVKKIAEFPDKYFDIIITHHLPSWRLIDEKYKDSEYNDFFASKCDYLLPKARYWVHGHSHTRQIEDLDGTIVLRNPLGYPGENGELLDLVIEV